MFEKVRKIELIFSESRDIEKLYVGWKVPINLNIYIDENCSPINIPGAVTSEFLTKANIEIFVGLFKSLLEEAFKKAGIEEPDDNRYCPHCGGELED